MTILKFSILTLLSMGIALPAVANTMTKGSKSYQSSKSKTQDGTVAVQQDAADVTKIEPAAGANDDVVQSDEKGKSFKEEMRLPRKN